MIFELQHVRGIVGKVIVYLDDQAEKTGACIRLASDEGSRFTDAHIKITIQRDTELPDRQMMIVASRLTAGLYLFLEKRLGGVEEEGHLPFLVDGLTQEEIDKIKEEICDNALNLLCSLRTPQKRTKKDGRAITSRINGRLGGRPNTQVVDPNNDPDVIGAIAAAELGGASEIAGAPDSEEE